MHKFFYKNSQIKCDHDKILKKYVECQAKILEAKKNYILNMTSKLVHSHTAPKTCSVLLNRLHYNKKISAIPPLLVDGKFVSDCCEKGNFFNNFFVSVCTPIKSENTFPFSSYRIYSRIRSFKISKKDILLILKSLDPSTAHGCDNLSIKMIQICNEVITIPLKIRWRLVFAIVIRFYRLRYFLNWIKGHPLKEHKYKFEIDILTYSKSYFELVILSILNLHVRSFNGCPLIQLKN